MSVGEERQVRRTKIRRRYGGIPTAFLFFMVVLSFLLAEIGWVSEEVSRFLMWFCFALLPVAFVFALLVDGEFNYVGKNGVSLVKRKEQPIRYWGLVAILILLSVVIFVLIFSGKI